MNWKQKLIKEIKELQEEPTREGIIDLIENYMNKGSGMLPNNKATLHKAGTNTPTTDVHPDKLGDSFTKFLESEGYEVKTVK